MLLRERMLGCLNNIVYKVLTIGDKLVGLQSEITGQLREVPFGFVRGHTHLCFAMTVAGVQGLTCSGSLRLMTRHPHFGLKHLFVCSSGATSWQNLEIV